MENNSAGEKVSISHLHSLSLIPRKHPLSLQRPYLTSHFFNCMQKAVTSVHLSWNVGFKNAKSTLLTLNVCTFLFVHLLSSEEFQTTIPCNDIIACFVCSPAIIWRICCSFQLSLFLGLQLLFTNRFKLSFEGIDIYENEKKKFKWYLLRVIGHSTSICQFSNRFWFLTVLVPKHYLVFPLF